MAPLPTVGNFLHFLTNNQAVSSAELRTGWLSFCNVFSYFPPALSSPQWMYKYVREYFTSFYHFSPSRKKFLMRGKITKEELGLKAGANIERGERGGAESGILNRTFQHLARTEIFAKTASFLLTQTNSYFYTYVVSEDTKIYWVFPVSGM